MPQPLDPQQLAAATKALPAWSCQADCLERSYTFTDFATAIAFMAECVAAIERLDHHPQWTNTYRTVAVRLSTHDAGNLVTSLDVQLAKTLDWTAERFSGS